MGSDLMPAIPKEESTMNWEQWFCPNQACAGGGSGCSQRAPTTPDIWAVAAHLDDRPFTVAAMVPICPRCGTTLRTTIQLEVRLDRHFGAEVEPVVVFEHRLGVTNQVHTAVTQV